MAVDLDIRTCDLEEAVLFKNDDEGAVHLRPPGSRTTRCGAYRGHTWAVPHAECPCGAPACPTCVAIKRTEERLGAKKLVR